MIIELNLQTLIISGLMRGKMKFLIPVHEKDIEIAKNTINSIRTFEPQSKITLLTHKKNFIFFDRNDLEVIDENNLIPSLNFETIKQIVLSITGSTDRTGWYFQQFLKMAFSYVCNEDYIVWDADTLMLNKISFVEEDKYVVFFKQETEHTPYLNTFHKLFPNVFFSENKSFVTEKMIINSDVMLNLIHSIESRFRKPFYLAILENIEIEHINFSGFSEFATYANYALSFYPENFKIAKANHFRSGTKIFGEIPILNDLIILSRYYDTVSFEKWEKKIKINYKLTLFIIKNINLRYFLNVLIKTDGALNILSNIIKKK